MARLEIEIAGVNSDLKRVLRETNVELNNFAKGLDFKPTGIDKINRSLLKTAQLLRDIKTISDTVRNAIGNRGLFESPSVELNDARTATEAYRTETARLATELQALRLQQAQSRTATAGATGSYREAQQTLTALGRSIREAEGGFRSTDPAIRAQITQYRQLNESLRAFDAQLGNHQRSVGNYQRALIGLRGLAATYFGFTALLAAGRAVVKNNAEISDSLADVRRTAGLSAKEATNLGSALKEIDTRTGLKDLLGISAIGGQLNIAKDQLAGFTTAVDQLSVSLGSELKGGAEGIAKSLGVLDNVFKISASNGGNIEKSYNQIGSAILQLGQSGLATGDFLADFGERVGGLAKQAGISLPVILSYGAVLQENGVSAEVAGSAFKRLISALSSNSEKFFAIAKFADANLTLKQFNTIINTDTKKALDLFLQGLNKGGKSTIAFNSILKSLKISGAGASQVVSALSNNLPGLEQHIKESTAALNDGTLASEQFQIKNNNLAASIDKLGNAITNITTNPDSNLGIFFKSIVDTITDTITGVDTLTKKIASLNDELIIKKSRSGIGNFSQADAEGAFTRRRERNTAALQDQITGRGSSTADMLAAGKSEIEIRKILTGEIYKQGEAVKRLNYNLAFITNPKNVGAPLDAQITKTNKLRVALAQQVAVVDRLKSKLKPVEQPRSDQEAVDLKGNKKPKASKAAPVNKAVEILRQSTNAAANAEVDGVKEKLQKLDQVYAKYYSDLENNAKKSAEGRRTLEADRITLAANKLKEQSSIQIEETKRVESEIARIRSEADIKGADGINKELAALDKKYNQEIEKANGNELLLSAITEAAEKSRSDIQQKYADKRIEAEQKIYDKISDLTEKGFTDNVNGSAKGRAQIQRQLDDRLKDIQKHFDELRKLYASQPEMLLGIAVNQGIATSKVTGAAEKAKNPVSEIFNNEVAGAVKNFSNNFIGVLSNINGQADKTFSGIFTSLTDSLIGSFSDVFKNVLAKQLESIISKSMTDLSAKAQLAVGSVALLGGAISGATKKTSSLGQGLGGALSGGAAGFAVGGPIGAAIGGVIGAIGGIFGAKKARKEEALQKAQLEESKKQTALLERQNALAYSASIIGRATTNGIVTGVEINEFGQLTTKISGQDIQIVLNKANNSRQRGT